MQKLIGDGSGFSLRIRLIIHDVAASLSHKNTKALEGEIEWKGEKCYCENERVRKRDRQVKSGLNLVNCIKCMWRDVAGEALPSWGCRCRAFEVTQQKTPADHTDVKAMFPILKHQNDLFYQNIAIEIKVLIDPKTKSENNIWVIKEPSGIQNY